MSTISPVIYLDVETRRPRSQKIIDYLTAGATPRANLVDPVKIAASIAEAKDKAIESSSLSPLWAEIAVMCYARTGTKDVYTAADDDETKVLQSFNNHMAMVKDHYHGRHPIFCGFNIAAFDLRLIWIRMLIHGITPSVELQHDAKPWSDKVIDLRQILSGGDKFAQGTLQDWVVAFGGQERKGDIAGKDVPQALEEGRLEEVTLRCMLDVKDCMWLHGKIRRD